MVYLLLGTGFEETEAITPLDLMRRADIEVRTVGLNGPVITGSHGIPIKADITVDQINLTALDMIVLPGGLGGVASARACPAALEALRYAWEHDKFVAAICAGPTVLADLHITDGRRATCYPGCENSMGSAVMVPGCACIRDGNLITGTSAGCAVKFGLELIAALRGSQTAAAIAQQIVIR